MKTIAFLLFFFSGYSSYSQRLIAYNPGCDSIFKPIRGANDLVIYIKGEMRYKDSIYWLLDSLHSLNELYLKPYEKQRLFYKQVDDMLGEIANKMEWYSDKHFAHFCCMLYRAEKAICQGIEKTRKFRQ